MSSPRISLKNVHVPWDGILAALGMPATSSRALPVRTRCPLCGADALHVYDDNTTKGQWHHCRGCGSSGDMIELAAKVWKMTPESVVMHMERGATPAEIARYGRQADGRSRIHGFWETCRQRMQINRGTGPPAVMGQYYLHLDVSRERWAAGPAHLAGTTTKIDVDRAFYPFLADGLQADRTLSRRMLKGAKWENILISPFFDLPGRIRAFAMIGREARRPADEVVRVVEGGPSSDVGLAGAAALVNGSQPGDVIVVGDWLFMLQIQFRAFRTGLRPMPLLAYHDDGSRQRTQAGSWAAVLDGQRPVIWCAPASFDYRVVRQAVAANARISMAGPVIPEREEVMKHLRDRPPEQLMRSIIRSAKPWPVALKEWLERAPDGHVTELMVRLEAAGEDVSHILRQCGRAGVEAAMIPVAVPRTVSLGAVRVTEREDRWEGLNPNRFEVLNATVRLTHAIKDRPSGKLYYFGKIRYRGSEVRFICPLETMQHHLQARDFLTEKLAEAGLGVLVAHASYVKHLHQLAVLFHEPEFVEDELWRWVEKLK